MKGWVYVTAALSILTGLSSAAEFELSDDYDLQQKCNGMYSQASWGGSVNPFISTKIENSTDPSAKDALVSFVIFEWRDANLIGIPSTSNGITREEMVCLDYNIKAGLCNSTQRGEFLLKPNATTLAKTQIVTKAIKLADSQAINYPITKTGYYCVWTWPFSEKSYHGAAVFRNSYGELPAAQIPKLPFYGGLTILYAVIGAFWAFLYVQNRHDICRSKHCAKDCTNVDVVPVQNYITAIIIFLVIEQMMVWGYYDYQNRNGNNGGTKALLVVTAILNAGRNSFSFFLLLITCMGYGIVKPSLGKKMLYVRILALIHFVFGVIYGIASLAITPDSAGPLILLVIMPLAASLTAFYVWTLNSLSATLKDLINRKQNVKALMYRRLWWCILGSILVIFAFFFLNSFTFARRSSVDFIPNNWKTRWFILDGWLNLVYLFDICFIAYLWRPTVNNRRFAMSDEIAQDDDGNFEIASFGGSLDEEEGEGDVHVPHRDFQGQEGFRPGMPKEAPQRARHSLDGETIFAIGEDGDKMSDEESDEEYGREMEGKSLTR